MVSYKELGLVNTREMFAKAIKGGYAIPAFNFNNMEQLQAIISACVEANSPVILQVSAGARKYANQTLLRYMAQGAVEYAKELNGGKGIPITLHLDHGNSFELCKSCIDMGFSSVMIDGSSLPYDENVALTKKGRRVCSPARRDGRRRAGRTGRRRRRGSFGGRALHQARRGDRFRDEDRRRLAGHLDRRRTAPTSSSPNSAPATPRASSFRLNCASTFWPRSRRNSPDSPSCCMVLRRFRRST